MRWSQRLLRGISLVLMVDIIILGWWTSLQTEAYHPAFLSHSCKGGGDYGSKLLPLLKTTTLLKALYLKTSSRLSGFFFLVFKFQLFGLQYFLLPPIRNRFGKWKTAIPPILSDQLILLHNIFSVPSLGPQIWNELMFINILCDLLSLNL